MLNAWWEEEEMPEEVSPSKNSTNLKKRRYSRSEKLKTDIIIKLNIQNMCSNIKQNQDSRTTR